MAYVKVNARDLIFQVSDGAATPTWLSVPGLTEAALDRGDGTERTDVTSFDDAGNQNEEIMQRGAKYDLTTFLLIDSITGALHPSISRLVALGELSGFAANGAFRFRYPTDTLWTIWQGTVDLGAQDGGVNDKTKFKATISRQGAKTTATAP